MAEEKSQAEMMMEAAEGFDNMASLGASYRVKLEAAGFSPTMAEQIAGSWLVDFQRCGLHQSMMAGVS